MIPYYKAGRLKEVDEDFQKAVADIQFFGSAKQIQYIQKLVKDLVELQLFNPEPLLSSLRDDLRRELGKEQVQGVIAWVALFKEPEGPKPKGPEEAKEQH